MTERIAAGEIFVGLNDTEAVAGLRKVEAEFARTMQRIDRQEADVTLKADTDRLKSDLAKAKAQTAKYRKYVEEADTEYTRRARRNSLRRVEQEEKEARAALTAHQKVARARNAQSKQEAADLARRIAAERRIAQIERLNAQAQRRRNAALRAEESTRVRLERQRAREMTQAHTAAVREDRDRRAAITSTQKQEVAAQRLQRRYMEARREVEKMRRELNKIRTPRPIRQRLELKTAEAIAEMELIHAELSAMGKIPIHQEIELDLDRDSVDTLNKWINALTQTTVRVGPFTTTIAGMARTLLMLGPIFSGLVGQAAAFGSVLGAGVAGGAGVAAGAVGALGLSLGGVVALFPSLLNDFKGLNTLQKAYHTQVLKTGRNSEKAKTKLKEFQHALGAVPPTTQRAFLSLGNLQKRWNNLSKQARPTFFKMLGEGIDTVNHHFDWFARNTLAGFEKVGAGWEDWMKGLRSREATQILQTLGEQGNRSIRPLMHAIGNIATGMGRVAAAFSRYLPDLIKGFDDWTGGFVEATDNVDKLDGRAHKLVDSMRAVGRLVMSVGRVITAFFAPGVDDGTDMINGWADGLNNLAHEMRTTKRTGLDEWFERSIDTANRFWRAVKPLAQLFFEWTTIMGGFTDAALSLAKPVAEVSRNLADIWAVRKAMQIAFGIFLTGAILKRVAGVAGSIRTIATGIGAIKAAGGIGGALKGGLLKFATGGLRGQTPANPMYVWSVNGGGGAPGPVGGKPGGGGPGGFLSKLPRFAKVGGGIGALAAGMVALTKAADNLNKSRGLEDLDRKIQNFVRKRDMKGLIDLRNYVRNFGGNNKDFLEQLDRGAKMIDQLNDRDLNKVTRTMKGNWKELRNDTKISTERIDNLVDYHFRLIEANVGKHSQQAKEAASKNFWQARREIKRAIDRSAIDSDDGLRKIEQLWIKTMAMYGFNKKAARNMAKGRSYTGGREEGQSGYGKARGGLIQVGHKGQRDRDSVPFNLGGVPSVVANGEQIAVFNHHQQQRFAQTYPGGLEGFFSGPQPRHSSYSEGGLHHYAGGGIVPVPGFPGESAASSVIPMILSVVRRFPGLILTDAYGQGHKSPGHTQFGTAADFAGPDKVMDAAVRALVAAGYLVGYDGRFGSQAWPGHGPSYVAGGNAHLHVEFGSGGGALASMIEDIPRVMIDGSHGLASAVGQRVVDIARDAANQSIQNMAAASLSMAMPGGGLGGGLGGGGSMAAKQYAQAQLGRYGWGPGEWPALNSLWQGESGWNPNAVNPSSGAMGIPQALGHGNVFALGDYMAQVNWGLRYIKSRYGSPSKAYAAWLSRSPHWYNEGGLATMGSSEWARGGRIERPTLMTGEDGRKSPEFVISTNPMFRDSNLDSLRQAAEALGVGQARAGKKPKKGKKVGSNVGGFGFGGGGQGGPGTLKSVKRYGKLQQQEDDTNREISIANSQIKEPDTFVKEGTDAQGNPTFEIDQGALTTYQNQMDAVRKLYDHLVFEIMQPMIRVGGQAMTDLALYISNRNMAIDSLQSAIRKDRHLTHSKDKDVRKKAEKRLAKNKDKLEKQQGWRDNARDFRSDIGSDLHDASYRIREYNIERGSLIEDIAAIQGRADEELAGARESGAGTAEPTMPTQQAAFDTERANILRQFGSNFGAMSSLIPTSLTAGGGGMQLNPATINNLSSSLGAVMTSSIASSGVASGAAAGAAMATGSGSLAAVSSGSGTALDQSKTVNMEVNNTFLAPPPDPHTFTKGMQFEANALV